MPKRDKIAITRDDEFAEVEDALSSAMEQLDGANTRIEALLAEQTSSETDTEAPENSEQHAGDTQESQEQ